MERYNLATLTKKIYESKLSVFDLRTIEDVLEVKKRATLFSVIKKLIKSGILTKIERGKYLLKSANLDDFVLANFLYQPSYISFETALNFYNILSQFPYEISSATSKKTAQKRIDGKVFSYTKIKKSLFWGYEKRGDFLIALPEKALLDQLYLTANGKKKINVDELNLEEISVKRFKNFLNRYPKTRQFMRFIKNLKQKEINI